MRFVLLGPPLTAYRRSVPPLALRATSPVSGESVLKGSHYKGGNLALPPNSTGGYRIRPYANQNLAPEGSNGEKPTKKGRCRKVATPVKAQKSA